MEEGAGRDSVVASARPRPPRKGMVRQARRALRAARAFLWGGWVLPKYPEKHHPSPSPSPSPSPQLTLTLYGLPDRVTTTTTTTTATSTSAELPRGISPDDAARICNAWAGCGRDGASVEGSVYVVPPASRVGGREERDVRRVVPKGQGKGQGKGKGEGEGEGDDASNDDVSLSSPAAVVRLTIRGSSVAAVVATAARIVKGTTTTNTTTTTNNNNNKTTTTNNDDMDTSTHHRTTTVLTDTVTGAVGQEAFRVLHVMAGGGGGSGGGGGGDLDIEDDDDGGGGGGDPTAIQALCRAVVVARVATQATALRAALVRWRSAGLVAVGVGEEETGEGDREEEEEEEEEEAAAVEGEESRFGVELAEGSDVVDALARVDLTRGQDESLAGLLSSEEAAEVLAREREAMWCTFS